jgi:PhzF family phenazine biosynthesis protein
MSNVAFKQVDVFTTERFKGNPVAVVLDGGRLSTAQMQRIANWTNLSETTFVVPATDSAASYGVRIFTPMNELPFAGHPTIGTAHALLEAERVQPRDGVLVQQCDVGLVNVSVVTSRENPRTIFFELPAPKVTPISAHQTFELADLLPGAPLQGADPLVVNVGPRWLIAQFASAAEVLALQPDFQRLAHWDTTHHRTGVVVFGAYPPGGSAALEVRAFAPASGVNEDPVCGSGNGCVAAYIRHTGQISRFGAKFLATQGQAVGRAGTIHVDIADHRISIGGSAVTCIDGQIAL